MTVSDKIAHTYTDLLSEQEIHTLEMLKYF